MPLYEIPIYRRVVNVSRNESFPKKEEILHVDAVGVFLLYNEENQKDVSFIRKHLVGRVSGRCILEANNSKEAIKKFHTEYERARIGGKRRKAKAMWINEEEYIFELPHCELLHRNNGGEFICGELSEEGEGNQGEWGMCMLENYSAPEDCLISEFYENWRHKSVPFIMVNWFKVVESLSY